MKKSNTTKNNSKNQHLGTHVIAEFFGCNKTLENAERVSEYIKAAVIQCGATILHEKFHKFSPQGLTGYLLLAESHASIHTWPEHNYAAVDIFTCGTTINPHTAIEYLKEKLCTNDVEIKTILRGDVYKTTEQNTKAHTAYSESTSLPSTRTRPSVS
ncbi:MAG: adenosylmethionine decarboxylase [Candidatus Harrisonbacteria bacterium CG10_big_fil_rev_8_21_14_0_10_42_17]|uniref:S-adenosylmethionine decarboxylase proenzyme n=1 Tax=Candidatus Harrisonbacteria bacterium CG10_big_fil_rev_8_21_14_0_10_42_17 TaxID=1974584 RepID=A0A2M6WJ39_9BACT|nr:MAG: adenosylmethionine decarboxylase [Candidatus Harrisonbacteria bacterium CG10_big_fil_rev_8_21_14_0_10_42_17]